MRMDHVGWKIGCVRSFCPMRQTLSSESHSVHADLKTPWFGKGQKNGIYSTKSAYRMLAESMASSNPGPSNPTVNSGIWKDIWGLRAPNKIKHFLWRACCEALPTKKNLLSRHVTRNATCECCDWETEDAIHALWDCQVLKEIWWEVEHYRSYLSSHFTSFRDLLTRIFHFHEHPILQKF